MRARFLLRLILVVIPTIGLMLLWLAVLPRQGQAAPRNPLSIGDLPMGSAAIQTIAPVGFGSAPIPTIAQVGSPAPTPDPRWLEIVRAQASIWNTPAGNAAAAASITINLNLTDQLAAGRVPSAAPVDIKVMDQEIVLSEVTAMPVFDGNGFFYMVYLFDASELQPGYGVWVTQGSVTFSMTVPTLTGLAYPQTDILSGTAPANAALTGYLFPFAAPDLVYTATATASVEGTYQMAWLPSIDLRSQDSGYLQYAQDAARQAYTRFVAPFLRLQVGGTMLYGAAAPFQNVDLVVKDDTGAVLEQFNASTGRDGYFYGGLCMSYGYTAFLPSYRVIGVAGGQTFSATVVAVTAHADQQAGQVTGLAPAGQPVEIGLFTGPLQDWGLCVWYDTPVVRQIVTATLGGAYTATLPLQAGNYGFTLATTSEGNQVYTQFALPYLYARLGGPLDVEYGGQFERIWGQVGQQNVPITVEVQGPSGYLKDWYTLYAGDSGYFMDRAYYAPDLLLESGDRITLTTSQGPQITLLLPVLSAEADTSTDIVSGQAPPLSQLVVTIGYLQLTVTADAQGYYSADFSGLGGLGGLNSGNVAWTSPEGYTVARYFEFASESQSDCPPRLSYAQIGGIDLALQGDYNCGAITLRLRGSDGQVKFEQVFDVNPGGVRLYDEKGRPVLIASGDHIEIELGGQVVSNDVPLLTVYLDPQADQVYGQAPPLALLDSREVFGTSYYMTTTATAQGTYTFDLAGIVDMDAGSSVQVAIRANPAFYAFGVAPDLETELYSRAVWGWLQPFTPYTITLSSPLTVSAPITGYASSVGHYPWGAYPPPVGYAGNPGDHVKMETPGRLWEMILPLLTANVDTVSGVVSGQAPPASRLQVNLYANNEPPINTIITATASGTYSITFPVSPGPTNVSGRITHFTAFDMRTYLNFGTPHWYVLIGSGQVGIGVAVTNVPITVTLHSYDGLFTQTIVDKLHSSRFYGEFDRRIQPGDRLEMEIAGGMTGEFTVPYLSAVFDFARRVLEGYAPPGGELQAGIPNGEGIAYRNVRLLSDGRYGVDASDLNPTVGGTGYIQYHDRFGNTVDLPFPIRGYPLFLPVLRWSAAFP
jgi:hypothetical protein